MHIHIPDKNIKENILKDNPVPANVKEPQVLDNYIKELLTENKRTLTSTHEKSLKAWQEKVLHILGPLSRLWMIMENKKLSSSGCEDQEVQEMTAISSLFEQTTLLIGQAFHSVTYYHWQNILSTLIDNPSTIKEILRDPDMALDNIRNTCLFGDKFKEKLLKDTNAKQKSKLIFSGLQRKSANNSSGTLYNNQPFVGALYPDSVPAVVEGISSEQHHTETRKTTVVSEKVLIRQDLKHVHPLLQNLFPQEQRSGLPVVGRLKHFQENWKKLTSNPQILEDYQIPFSSEPKQTKLPNPVHLTKKEETFQKFYFRNIES